MLPPANMGKRVFASVLDLLLVFFLSLFIVGKLWLPVHHADDYSFGLMFGNDGDITDEEIWELAGRPLTLNEAKALLNEFGVSKDEITVIPVIQPISSYAYEIDDEYRERVNKLFE